MSCSRDSGRTVGRSAILTEKQLWGLGIGIDGEGPPALGCSWLQKLNVARNMLEPGGESTSLTPTFSPGSSLEKT